MLLQICKRVRSIFQTWLSDGLRGTEGGRKVMDMKVHAEIWGSAFILEWKYLNQEM